MKTCPNCGEKSFAYHTTCKYCGYIFSTTQENIPKPRPTASLGCGSYAFIGLALLALFMVIFACMSSSNASKPPTRAEPNVEWLPLGGHIFAGVKVYYGTAKTYGFTILGADDTCSIAPSGQGVYVQFPDGSKDWKDRGYLLDAGIYYISVDDPHKSDYSNVSYQCP